ncbi:3-hydroxybutyryl- dehydratase [Fusarium albosuccineum]|uniref:3-hydroxybutyryl- dehydratase n=1 Tax=Fusarium albosuccineum TaxID=1237068 RepID=A0A8H4NNL6_9HYPO|nr:3-hydroxybutyryl- dehydratase [Fusarium albosuccineum]
MPSSPNLSIASSDNGYLGDDWPRMPDGTIWDGRNLLDLLRKGQSPFSPIWDVNLLFQEVEDKVGAKVIDVPCVHTGSNNYGFHLKLSDQRDVLARLGNADVNMPHYDGFSLHWLHKQLEFEAATYRLLQNNPDVPTDPLLYHRHPLQHGGIKTGIPEDISGRRLMIFEMANGQSRLWDKLDEQQKPVEWMPKELPLPISATRDFWLATFKAKVETMIKNEGDIIGWPEDKETVGPRALAAKKSLLQLIPLILPEGDEAVLYRPVLQHDDFGIHNMLNLVTESDQTRITSVFDWETGCIVPAVMSEITFMIVGCDLITDENGEPSVYVRSELAGRPEERAKNSAYSAAFLMMIKRKAPYLQEVLYKAKDARYLWIKLKKWKGQEPEEFFGQLGDWAEERLPKRGLMIPLSIFGPEIYPEANSVLERNRREPRQFDMAASMHNSQSQKTSPL